MAKVNATYLRYFVAAINNNTWFHSQEVNILVCTITITFAVNIYRSRLKEPNDMLGMQPKKNNEN